MKIGIIGISSLTMELAFRSARQGYTVTVYNPKGNSLIRDALEKFGPTATTGTLEQAASADIILLFIPKDDLENVLNQLPDVSGKIIIHTSGLIFDPQTLLSGITNAMTYKITASLLPQAHVVKLFHPVDLQDKNDVRNKEQIFFIADHRASKNYVKNFLKQLDFSPVDLSGRIHLQNKGLNLDSIFHSSARRLDN
ncbi:NAD(P)-binding domain-containing protein [Flavobacterium endoglycinae]|uniref:NAD(P)-binding domain-containing protein n=1 Tax=Flavobacterium endoglycinae TaxID=2816357 RepID=A0ABX7QE22_9FLAO|nr:NAD(P)-binding domain-containing protein [Flavobacterium endoglycinae]QSW88904.1 NAD(P)-binding domain-containing protein [Flavobacterium endoglycinae]